MEKKIKIAIWYTYFFLETYKIIYIYICFFLYIYLCHLDKVSHAKMKKGA